MVMVLLTALGVGGATVIGAIIGFIFKNISHKFSDIVLSFAAGVMLAAAVLGLIIPSVDYGGKYGIIITVVGIFAGALCLNLIDKLVPHLHKLVGPDTEEHHNANLSKVLLFVAAIAIHNLPEGIAAGVGFGAGAGLGSANLEREKEDAEKRYAGMKERIEKALKERFRPEFLNRLDDIIVFHALSEEDCVKIAEKIVEGLAKRLQEQRGVYLCVTSGALSALVKEGYDPQYGARPLKRVIQRRVEDRLSEEILLGRVCAGDKVTVDFVNGEIVFR